MANGENIAWYDDSVARPFRALAYLWTSQPQPSQRIMCGSHLIIIGYHGASSRRISAKPEVIDMIQSQSSSPAQIAEIGLLQCAYVQ